MVTLESCKTFRCLGASELSALRSIAVERKYPAGQEIFKEGDNGDGIYVVTDGEVEISARIAQDQRRVLAHVGPGEIFGEMAVIELKPRSATATAAKESIVHFIGRDELLELVARSAEFAMELLREISQRLRQFDQRYLQEILQTERLAVIGRFARSIVHDIKNPLNIISLTSEVSGMDKATPETRKKATATIRKQVERVSEMISEILDFTQGSKSNLILTPIGFGEFVNHLIEEMRPEVELRNSRLETSAVPSIRLEFDPKRLRRVFFNLIHNATDAMPEGGRILMRFIVNETEVVTEIEDTGPGIAPEMTDRLFQVFATHGKEHGTGLGLSICKKIAEDHRGRIWARNEPGRGAIFAFALPLRK